MAKKMQKSLFTLLINKSKERNNDKITEEEYISWIEEKLIIRKYIPIIEKYALIELFEEDFEGMQLDNIKNFKSEENLLPKSFFLSYEISKIFLILLSYTNIISIKEERNLFNYEILMESGFIDYIEKIIYKDYNYFLSLLKDYIGIHNFTLIKYLEQSFGGYYQENVAENILEMVNSIDESKLDKLNILEKFNNPIISKAFDTTTKIENPKN